jgi:hypothetical protein
MIPFVARMASPPAGSRAAAIEPATTLADLFGPGVVYGSRRSPLMPGWAPSGPGKLDSLTGNQLAVAGRIPYVVAAGAVTPPALALMEEAGLPVEAELRVYGSVREYGDLLRGLTASGFRHAAQRAHAEEEIPRAASLVDPELQRALNDKGRMEEFVPDGWLPRRSVREMADLPAEALAIGRGEPIVLKAASALPSGGGHCVWICRSDEDVDRARKALRTERLVVVEEFLRIRRTVCVHVNVSTDGEASFAGFAEEVSRPDGGYLGNWLDAESDDVPEGVAEVVLEITRVAAARGYRGIVGIGVALLEDGPPRVLDLNFRVNGSTASAWLRSGIERALGPSSLRVRSWECASGFAALLAAARRGVERGALLPLCLYDPSASGEGGPARLHGILLGPSRDAVRSEEHRLAEEGVF